MTVTQPQRSLTTPIAEWDFTRDEPTNLREALGGQLRLRPAPGPIPRWLPDPVVGGGIHFAGDGGHLMIPATEAAPLDLAEAGELTLLALVRRDGLGTGFIAGLWQEHDDDPRRQYGLFLDLPTYGGGEQVAAHISASGGPSPGLPYSRDYAASARMVRPGAWRVIGLRYDGREITAFLDGIADPRPEFTEVGPPLGSGLRAPKNPFPFADGLYRGNRSDFTVGAVLLSAGIGNAFEGCVARLALWDRALDDEAVLAATVAWTPPGEPLARFDWWRPEPAPGPLAGGAEGVTWPLRAGGLSLIAGDGEGLGVTPGKLERAAALDEAVLLARTSGLRRDGLGAIQIAGVSDAARVAAVVVAGGTRWYGHADAADGTIRASLDAAVWRMRTGETLSPLPLGQDAAIEAIGIALAPGAPLSIGELSLWLARA